MIKELKDNELEKVVGGDIYHFKNHFVQIIYNDGTERPTKIINTGESYVVTPNSELTLEFNTSNLHDCNVFGDEQMAYNFAMKKKYSLEMHEFDELVVV